MKLHPNQPFLFDLDKGQEKKEEGIQRVATHYAGGLSFAKRIAIDLGMSQDTVTVDDVQEWLAAHGYPMLGKEAGDLFRGGEWIAVRSAPSRRVSRHACPITVWKLRRRQHA